MSDEWIDECLDSKMSRDASDIDEWMDEWIYMVGLNDLKMCQMKMN